MRRRAEPSKRAAAACLAALLPALAGAAGPAPAAVCDKPVYLTFDTGHMGVAPLVADVLARHHVKVTFFLANERTLTDGASLDDQWAPWWKARAAEGHAFGSHTYDHVYWQGDLPDGKFRVKPSAGPQTGKVQTWTAQQYCEEIKRSSARFTQMTGHAMLPLYRAPGGKTSPALLKAARECGYEHVGWAQAGFLGDELPSDKFPNARLLEQALRNIKPGDILLAHLGIWSRQDPWAPAVLEPLVEGLQRKGYCFATLDTHPAYKGWIATHH
ncbi:polysaccharide deacetylase family protein [Achromobacter sp. AONIH1]|uniref:polysaccharide deacetylase family protein n=1 Tax=unclassified Achromobacter TaxID=2626865 RepID=UPI0018F8438B|nr:polysaccharide deacetylase family protein [Achromobacter sp. AONIH1]